LYDTTDAGREFFDLVNPRLLFQRERLRFGGLQDEIMLKTPFRILAMTALLVLAWMSY
jgi:hypothetical protein